MPASALTTPRRLICPMSRHFLPVLQPDPPAWLTTGLRKGSLFPVRAYFFSGLFSAFAASALGVLAATLGLACVFEFLETTTGFTCGAPLTAGLLAVLAACAFCETVLTDAGFSVVGSPLATVPVAALLAPALRGEGLVVAGVMFLLSAA